jgi:biotin operon repressor
MYKRSQEIERRLVEVLRLIRTGRFSTPGLAEKVGVSIPTISRCVETLRHRGYPIRSVRLKGSWRYILEPEPRSNRGSHPQNQRLAHVSH